MSSVHRAHSNSSHNNSKPAAVVLEPQTKMIAAAVVAAIPALWISYKAYRRFFRKAPPPTEDKCTEWTAKEVAHWLTSKKFSPACVKIFLENDVDGDTLLRLESSHLTEMGVTKVKDRILFERVVQPLRQQVQPEAAASEDSDDEEETTPVEQPKESTVVRTAANPDPEEQEMGKILVLMMEQLQGIYRVCSSEEFLNGEPESQRKTIVACKHKLHEVTSVLALLPAEHQTAVIPLVKSLSELIHKVEESLNNGGAKPAAPPVQLDDRTKASLAKLQVMLQGFTESICSDEAAALPAQEKHRLTENINVQVAKILQALSALPASVAEPLVQQCREVLRLSKELLDRPAVGHGQARSQRLGQPAEPVQRASLEFLVNRLRAVFEALRSPKTLELAAEPRLQLIAQMESDVSSVAAEAEHLSPQEKSILQQVLQNVASVLQQIKMITMEEQKAVHLKEAQQQQQQQQRATTAAKEEEDGLTVEQVSNAIRGILTMLKSQKFVEAPREAQRQLAERMLQQLQSLSSAVEDSMGPAEKQHLLPMITKVSQLVSAVAAQASKKSGDGKPASPSAAGATAADDEVSEDFMKIIATLKQVFDMVNSKQFQSAPPASRQSISKELLQHVVAVEQSSKSLPAGQQNSVQQMIAPLIRLLTAVSSAPPARQAAPAAPEAEEEEEASAPSAAFSAIISSLQEVFEVVNSDGFKKAPMQAQQEVANQLLDHVRTLTSHFGRLSAEERATANRFVQPLKELLEAIVSQDAPASNNKAATKEQATQQGEDEQDDEDEEENGEDVSNAKATYDVISKLQRLYAVAQSDNFINAEPPQRQRIATMILSELKKLEQETTSLRGEQRMQVVPLIRQLGQLLASSASSYVEDVEEEGEAEDDAEEEQQEQEDREDDERAALFERAVDAVITMRNRTINMEELEAMLELIDEVDAAGIRSKQEITIRQALHNSIKESIKKIQQEQGIEPDEDEEEQADQEEEEKPKEKKETISSDMFNFTRFFNSLLELLRSAELQNTRQLIPFTERVESTLNDADEQGLPWRRNAEAFRAVTDVLTEVQNVQQRLQAQGPSEIEQVLRSATADVLKDKPATVEELSPYLELLGQLAKMQDQMTIEDLQAYQELQKAVILVRDGILQPRSPGASQQNSPMSRTKSTPNSSTLTSPMFTTAVPPNTPANTMREAPEDEDEEDEEEGEGEEEDGEPSKEDAMILEMLFQIYQKLQRQRYTNEELAPFERVIQQLRSKKTHSSVTQILDAVEELLEQHRNVNEEEMAKVLAEERKQAEKLLRQENERPSPSKNDTPFDEDEAADAVAETIEDGLINQLALLARILERLQLPDFMQTTTVFEIRCIGKILVHLSNARTVTRNSNLKEAVERAKVLFGDHIQSFHGSPRDGTSVTCAINLTGMALELDRGEHVTQYTLIGAEEEEYTINEAFVAKLDGNALEVGKPPKATVDKWDSNSRCIIFSIQQYPEGRENPTSLSELTMLADTLDEHGFDVTSVASEGITAQDAKEVIQSVLNERPSRLFVYYYTPEPPSIAPETHAVTFTDGSTLAHRDVAALCKDVERVVIVHDQTRRLEVAASRDGSLSSYVSVALTEGAAQIANTSRCWLFEGVFTPAVVETISSNYDGFLCPEELITGPIGLLTGKTISHGSFSDEPALKMAFFGPTDQR